MTADGEGVSMVTEPQVMLVECDVCFAMIKETGVENHRYWHRVSASPMGLGLYLTQFPLLNGEVPQ